MDILFVNTNPADDFIVSSPFERPLPGTQSAVCFMALALKKLGLDIGLVSAIAVNQTIKGIAHIPQSQLVEAARAAAVVVLVNDAEAHLSLRSQLGPSKLLISWDHNFWQAHSKIHQQALRSLTGENDKIICVSAWHRQDYIVNAGLPAHQIMIVQNAISPLFQDIYPEGSEILCHKDNDLIFTSTPYKGLVPALEIFKLLYQQSPNTSLSVYSSFALYPKNNINRTADYWNDVIEGAKNQPGVSYQGIVTQADLAVALKRTKILYYPNIMPETSGIAVMEAMAAGCLVISTDLGAMKETTAGFAMLAPFKDGRLEADSYMNLVRQGLQRFEEDRDGLEQHLQRQVSFVKRQYSWENRAAVFANSAKRWLT